MRASRASLVLFLFAVALRSASAQTGVFKGVVSSDTLEHPVPRAEVALPELRRTTATNEHGEFQFSDVPAGHYAIVVRAIGFQLLTASIDIPAGGSVDAELTLLPTVALLDSVRTTAAVTPKILPRYQEFEFRQRAKIGGYFLSDSALRRHDRENLSSVIGMLPSVQVRTESSGTYLLTSHGGSSAGPAFSGGAKGMGPCLFAVYVDGQKIYQSGDGNSPPDFSRMHVEDYYGVEVYPSLTSAPAQYSPTGPQCGAILLWTRPINHP